MFNFYLHESSSILQLLIENLKSTISLFAIFSLFLPFKTFKKWSRHDHSCKSVDTWSSFLHKGLCAVHQTWQGKSCVFVLNPVIETVICYATNSPYATYSFVCSLHLPTKSIYDLSFRKAPFCKLLHSLLFTRFALRNILWFKEFSTIILMLKTRKLESFCFIFYIVLLLMPLYEACLFSLS